MGSCAAPSAKGDDKFITTDYLQQCPPELSLERPLFDTEVYVNGEKKYVLPDFIVTARAPDGKTARVVIETMGYEDSDYCARKSRQHTGMKQIGVLHTDPPKWLDNEHPPFKKHMYGVFMHLRY
ncbi:hypothetical protein F9B07_27485 [Escherichia coli]|uniref:Uncharacterized protein n=1 Tax=Escherichia coli TaxID=562 RepID=A0A6L6I9T7_ECOLX|nr:hypothetical protein [Escherichia coli]